MLNVVLAGECGAGKSSLINLIVGRDVAKTSNDTTACTMQAQSYKVFMNGHKLRLWDTPGLDEGSTTGAYSCSSETLSKSLLRIGSQDDIHLLVYCMHGNRAKTALLKHYKTIRNLLPPSVPIVAAITRLERHQGRMEDWWSNNAQELANHGVIFADHACITTIPDSHGLSSVFRERLAHSQEAVRNLIHQNCFPRLSSIQFPVIPISKPMAWETKDSGDARPRTTQTQINACQTRATLHMRTIPASLFA